MNRLSNSFILSLAFLWTAVAASVCSAAGAPPQSPTNDTSRVQWRSLNDAMHPGKDNQKKVLLYFYADWCHYCKKMDEDTFMQSDVAAYMNTHFIPVRLDFDKDKNLAQKYRIRGLPATWFMDQHGEKIQFLPGYIPREMFLGYLKYIQTDSYRTMAFKEFISAQ